MTNEMLQSVLEREFEKALVERKIGDGKLMALFAKLIPILVQVLPLFMSEEETTKAIGDGTFVQKILDALSNPQFIQNVAGLIALIKSLFPAK